MRIIVLVKMVTEIFFPSYKAASLKEIFDERNKRKKINSYDLAALEEAQQIKKTLGYGSIAAIAVGNEDSRKALQIAHSMGAEELIWINMAIPDPNKINNIQLARVLSDVLKEREFDLILCGVRSDDMATGFLGVALAEFLNLPVVTRSWHIEPAENCSVVWIYRHIGKGDQEVVECPLPSVVTIERSREIPRHPSMVRYVTAKRKISEIKYSLLLEEDNEFFVELSVSRTRPKKIFTPDDSLSAAEKMKLIISGGLNLKKEAEQKEENLSGAEKLYKYLSKNHFLPFSTEKNH